MRLEDGGKGEFTVLIDGRPMPKSGDDMPTPEQVVAAVRQGQPAAAAAG